MRHKNVTRFISITLLIAMIFSLAACQKNTDKPTNTNPEPSNTQPTAPTNTQPAETQPTKTDQDYTEWIETAERQNVYLLSSVEIPFDQAGFEFSVKDADGNLLPAKSKGEWTEAGLKVKDYFKVATVATFFIASGGDFEHSSSELLIEGLPTMEGVVCTGGCTENEDSITATDNSIRKTSKSANLDEKQKGYLFTVRIAGSVDWIPTMMKIRDKSGADHYKTELEASFEDLLDSFETFKIGGVHYILYRKWQSGTDVNYIFTPVDGEYVPMDLSHFDTFIGPEVSDPVTIELVEREAKWCENAGALPGSTGVTLKLGGEVDKKFIDTAAYGLLIHCDDYDITK